MQNIKAKLNDGTEYDLIRVSGLPWQTLLPLNCPDPNCGGVLVHEIYSAPLGRNLHSWRCDGLTYDYDDGPLRACDRFIFGPLVQSQAA